jgi:hypothetical protein
MSNNDGFKLQKYAVIGSDKFGDEILYHEFCDVEEHTFLYFFKYKTKSANSEHKRQAAVFADQQLDNPKCHDVYIVEYWVDLEGGGWDYNKTIWHNNR